MQKAQPKLSKFPPKQSIPTSKQRQFGASWYNEYPHLEYSIAKDAAFCFICSLFHKEGQDPAWCETGVSAWEKMRSRGADKKSKLAEHFSAESHKQAFSAYVSFCKPLSHVDAMLDKALRNSTGNKQRQTGKQRSYKNLAGYCQYTGSSKHGISR